MVKTAEAVIEQIKTIIKIELDLYPGGLKNLMSAYRDKGRMGSASRYCNQ